MAMMSSPVQPGCSPVSRRRTHVNPERRAAPPHARAAGPLRCSQSVARICLPSATDVATITVYPATNRR